MFLNAQPIDLRHPFITLYEPIIRFRAHRSAVLKENLLFFLWWSVFFVRAGESLLSVPLNVGASEPVDDLCVSLYLHLD